MYSPSLPCYENIKFHGKDNNMCETKIEGLTTSRKLRFNVEISEEQKNTPIFNIENIGLSLDGKGFNNNRQHNEFKLSIKLNCKLLNKKNLIFDNIEISIRPSWGDYIKNSLFTYIDLPNPIIINDCLESVDVEIELHDKNITKVYYWGNSDNIICGCLDCRKISDWIRYLKISPKSIESLQSIITENEYDKLCELDNYIKDQQLNGVMNKLKELNEQNEEKNQLLLKQSMLKKNKIMYGLIFTNVISPILGLYYIKRKLKKT